MSTEFYIMDTSYIINMTRYFDPLNNNFSHIWKSVIDKNKSGEVLIIDKVKTEIMKFDKKDYLVSSFLPELKIDKAETPEIYQKYISKVVKVIEGYKSKDSMLKWIKNDEADYWILA